MTKISRTNFSEILQRAILQTMRGNLCGGAWDVIFHNIFWKESMVSSDYSSVTVCTAQTCNFIKTNSIVDVIWKTFTINYFSQYLKLGWRIKSNERSHASQEWKPLLWYKLSLNMKYLLGMKHKNRTLTFSI